MNEPRRITERYRLEKRVSSKASSSVFRAVDTLSGATVAVKLINAGDLDGNRGAFEAHLTTLQEIRHPALPRILDFGRTTAGSLFLVTEHLDGDDLGDLVEIPPARVLALLLQLADGLEAVAASGLALRNLSASNVRLVKAPEGEQVKILGLGSAAFLPAATGGTGGDRTDLRAFAHLATETLGLTIRDDDGTMAVALPLEVAGALAESERLREILEAGLRDRPGVRPPDWTEVRQALRAAFFGTAGRQPSAPVVSDDTIAVHQTGPAPAPRTEDFVTRVIRPDELARDLDSTQPVPPLPPAPAETARLQTPEPVADKPEGAGGRRGTLRIPLREIEDAPPPPGTLRFPSPPPPPRRPAEHDATMPRRSTPLPPPTPIPAPVPIPPPVPVSSGTRAVGAPAALPVPPPLPSTPPPPELRSDPSPAAAPLASPAPVAPPATAPAPRPGMAKRHLALLIGLPVAVFLVVLGLVAWWSRHAAEPEPQPVQAQPAPQPAPLPAPPAQPAPSQQSIHPQLLLAEEALSAGDLRKAGNVLAAILPEQIALFTAEEKDRYQQALAALTPLQSQEWAERLKRGLATGDLRLLRAAVASPPAAATLTSEQKKGLARARKLIDLDKRLTRAQRDKDHSETLRQATLLLAELPGNARAQQARSGAADALIAEADAHAAQAELEAAFAALEHLREGWPDHPGLAERLERLSAERRANDQMEEALAAAARAERAERPREGLAALDRVRPNERYAGRFQQARERLQAQLAQLDSNPPQVTLAGAADPYEKGATVTVRLRITDDQRVESVEAWVRPEGGRFTQASVRPLGGADYELQIGPDLHQNKNIDFYVTAADPSGHTSSLGSVQRPQKIKRKRWFSPR